MARNSVFAASIGLLGLFLLPSSGCQRRGTNGQTSGFSSGLVGPFSEQTTATIAEGTPIKIRTAVTLSTSANKPGDSFTGTLMEPVVAGSVVIATKGAKVRGLVADSDPGGRVKGRAHLAVRLTGFETAGNKWTEIRTEAVSRTARATEKKDAEKIGAGGAIGAAIGAIAGGGEGAAIGAAAGGGAGTAAVLATRGAAAVIPSESVLSFRLSAPVKISLES